MAVALRKGGGASKGQRVFVCKKLGLACGGNPSERDNQNHPNALSLDIKNKRSLNIFLNGSP